MEEKFKIQVPQVVLNDLKNRLEHVRWPDEANEAGWKYGTSLPYIQQLTSYWLKSYDWRKHESELNKLSQFTSKVDTILLHFVHERSSKPDAIPVLLLHGWPDSFYRFHKIIPLLKDSYHVVALSIPGMGFSEKVVLPMKKVGDLCIKLMKSLGYEHFISAGGDGGSMISLQMAQHHPDSLTGMYLTDVGYPDFSTDFASLSQPEQQFAGFVQNWWMKEGAFSMVHATKPQSLAYAFNDSPVGLASWIISMMSSLSTGEEIEKRFGKDDLITNIMIYWVTETIGSSMRIYFTDREFNTSAPPLVKSKVPAGVAHCPWDAPLPREWAERKTNLLYYSELTRGGHFTAWEEPVIWANDFNAFVKKLTA